MFTMLLLKNKYMIHYMDISNFFMELPQIPNKYYAILLGIKFKKSTSQ